MKFLKIIHTAFGIDEGCAQPIFWIILLCNIHGLCMKMDYFFGFQPNFGASLQILKVEIGGDIQSTGRGKYESFAFC